MLFSAATAILTQSMYAMPKKQNDNTDIFILLIKSIIKVIPAKRVKKPLTVSLFLK